MALTDNIVSYWKCDESSGNLADSAGSNTLTNVNTTGFTTGIINNGINLVAASSRYFEKTSSGAAGLSGMTDLTISFWFKPAANVTSEQEFVTVYSSGAGQRSYRFYADNGTLNFQNSADGTNSSPSLVSQTLSSGTWYYIALTKSGTTATYYVNASSLGTGVAAASQFSSTDPFRVGTRVAAGDFANGVLDEIGIWSRALSGAEITSLYNGGAGLQYPFGVTATRHDFTLLGVGT